jgi:heat shock protein HslJ
VLCAGLLLGCASKRVEGPVQKDPPRAAAHTDASAAVSPPLGSWVVFDLAEGPLHPAQPVTLEFTATSLSCNSTCNRYLIDIAYGPEGAVSPGAVPPARHGQRPLPHCSSELMQTEYALVRALERLSHVTVSAEGILTLSGFGTPLLRARRTAQRP